MLQKIERTILLTISKQPDKFNIEASQLNRYSRSDIEIAMISLKNKGYFEEANASIDLSNFTYKLTTQGRFYKEYRFQRFISNIFIPIVVSMLATLITSFLCG